MSEENVVPIDDTPQTSIPVAKPTQSLPIHKKSSKVKVIVWLIVVVLVGVLGVGGYFLLGVQVQKKAISVFSSPTLTPTAIVKETSFPSINEFISYQVPNNWKEESGGRLENGEPYLAFSSSDIKRVEGGEIPFTQGATIYLDLRKKDFSEDLTSFVLNYAPQSTNKNEVTLLKIGGLDAVGRFTAWEGYFKLYVVEKNGYILRINFECIQNCSTEKDMNQTSYAKDRDMFLKSISFK